VAVGNNPLLSSIKPFGFDSINTSLKYDEKEPPEAPAGGSFFPGMFSAWRAGLAFDWQLAGATRSGTAGGESLLAIQIANYAISTKPSLICRKPA
jgi:hypothetical protein